MQQPNLYPTPTIDCTLEDIQDGFSGAPLFLSGALSSFHEAVRSPKS